MRDVSLQNRAPAAVEHASLVGGSARLLPWYWNAMAFAGGSGHRKFILSSKMSARTQFRRGRNFFQCRAGYRSALPGAFVTRAGWDIPVSTGQRNRQTYADVRAL
jgi:hypothetical protein